SRDGRNDPRRKNDFSDSVIVVIRDEQVPLPVELDSLRGVQLGTSRRTAVAAKAGLSVPRDCCDHAVRINAPNALILIVGEVHVPRRILCHSIRIAKRYGVSWASVKKPAAACYRRRQVGLRKRNRRQGDRQDANRTKLFCCHGSKCYG